MKEKIMYLIIGILIGAIITAGCFLIFGKSNQADMPQGNMKEMRQMDGNMAPPDGANMTKPDGNRQNSDTTNTNT